jgi:hypothetical protein
VIIVDATAIDDKMHAHQSRQRCNIPIRVFREERQTYLASLGHLRHNDTIDPA